MSQDVEAGKVNLDDLRAKYRWDYDPYAAVPIAEFLSGIAERREKCPVSYSARGNGCWVVTKYDDIRSVLHRSNQGFISLPASPDGQNVQGSAKGMIPIEIDGPEHRQYRAALEPLFSPGRVAELSDHLRQTANALIDDFIEEGHCQFVEQFALPFPGATLLAVMGWPRKDMATLNGWAGTLLHGVVGGTEEETAAARGEAHVAVRDYMLAFLAERRAEHRAGQIRDDVTSMMLEAEFDGARMSDDDMFDFFLLMMLAGLDTVQSVFAQSMVFFASHQDKWQEMFADPDKLDRAVEELLRWAGVPAPTRTVVHDSVDVGGVPIPKGDRVHFHVSAANRDPQYYDQPDEVDFDRPRKPHIAFGLGAHRCLGVHLARLELKIGFVELHRRLPAFLLDPECTPQEHLGLAWGVENVHLQFASGSRELV